MGFTCFWQPRRTRNGFLSNNDPFATHCKPVSPDALGVVQYDKHIYDIFFSGKNLDCVTIHGNDEDDDEDGNDEKKLWKASDPKKLFESVGYDYSRMWNEEFEFLKQDGWGWANKYFQDEEQIDKYFNSDIMKEVKAGNCDTEVRVYEISRNFFI